MNSSIVVGMAIGIAISFCAGSAIWMLHQPGPATEAPAFDTARRERAENFFGGDPNRNVRGGQEILPRW